MSKVSFIFVFMLSLNFCYATQFKVETEPKDAEVFVENKVGKLIKLGKTPYETNLDQLHSTYSNQKFLNIVIEKKGFNSERIVFLGQSKDEITYNLKLRPDDYAPMIVRYDTMIGELFTAQKLIRSNNFKEAQVILDGLSEEYKDFSTIFELKGISYYMNKETEKALTMFRHAYSLNPKNIDSYRMKVYLEKELGLFIK